MLRIGAIGKVWEVRPCKINGYVNARVSTSHKESKEASGYKTDFSAYVNLRARIDEIDAGDTIIFDEFSVSTAYNADTKKQYTNFYVDRWHKFTREVIPLEV